MRPAEADHATDVLFAGIGYAVLWGLDALPAAYAALTSPGERS